GFENDFRASLRKQLCVSDKLNRVSESLLGYKKDRLSTDVLTLPSRLVMPGQYDTLLSPPIESRFVKCPSVCEIAHQEPDLRHVVLRDRHVRRDLQRRLEAAIRLLDPTHLV